MSDLQLERRVEQLELALAEHIMYSVRHSQPGPWSGVGERLVRSVRARFPRKPEWLERGRIG